MAATSSSTGTGQGEGTEEAKGGAEKKGEGKDEKKETQEPIKIDFDGLDRRVARIPIDGRDIRVVIAEMLPLAGLIHHKQAALRKVRADYPVAGIHHAGKKMMLRRRWKRYGKKKDKSDHQYQGYRVAPSG